MRKSRGATKKASDATAKNSSGASAAYGIEQCLFVGIDALAERVVLGIQHLDPGFLGGPIRQRRHAVGVALAHVHHVHELVDDDVVADLGRLAGLVDVAPGEHHRPAVHRLAGQFFLVLVHDAVVVDELTLCDHRVCMHDDALEAVVPVQAELQRRQTGLRGDRDGHLVVHGQALRAGELLVGEEQRGHLAQPSHLRFVAPGQERKARQREPPERLGNRAPLERASLAPALEPLAHGQAEAERASAGARRLPVARLPAQHFGAGDAAVVEFPVAEHLANPVRTSSASVPGRCV